ncbi:hypothetical protein [Vibrio sp. THAF190c]|uniref:hypothetical protein n=1 Tax=Vibrio sp. THAF190c TaxID=2587865 RepID=UPI001268EAD5|nr:hypothetical protein [Vibrio sp. THAF190c]
MWNNAKLLRANPPASCRALGNFKHCWTLCINFHNRTASVLQGGQASWQCLSALPQKTGKAGHWWRIKTQTTCFQAVTFSGEFESSHVAGFMLPVPANPQKAQAVLG